MAPLEGVPVDDALPNQPRSFQRTVSPGSRLTDTLFGHMLVEEAAASAAMARRRAMMLVDVLVERHGAGRLKRRWVFMSALLSYGYLRYVLPIYAHWGAKHIERSMDANTFAETVGGPHSQVNFGVLVVVTLLYLSMLQCSRRIMETRLPVNRIIFESLMVYNMTQMLLNSYLCVNLILEARALGFRYPWGNQFSYTKEAHRLGYYIWFQYHCCQLELFDTLFIVVRKKFKKITFLHVSLRLLNMWGWFFVCRYACGGDAYFPAATNAATRTVVYAFYSLSSLAQRGMPLIRKARVTGVQMFQLVVCTAHSLYCLYAFWNMQIPRLLLVLYLLIMLASLLVFTDFQFQEEGKSKSTMEKSTRRVSFSFDSSGWLYCYHFGVAAWLHEHVLPKGLRPEDCDTAKYPADLTFSGSSGGALVAAALSVGLDPAQVFDMVLEKHALCRYNPFRLMAAVEDVLDRLLPSNSGRSCTGRLRVLLTRVSWRPPFFTAEVVNQFGSRQDVFNALRASSHVPVFAGIVPYHYDGHYYIDGLLWPQLLVPWKGDRDDFMVRVSACSMPMSNIKPPLAPIWWTMFPPSQEILRGLFWIGYRDAGRWFALAPQGSFECFSCRKPVELPGPEEVQAGPSAARPEKVPSGGPLRRRRDTGSSGNLAAEGEGDGGAQEERTREEARAATWSAARGLLRAPTGAALPETDRATGKPPSQLVAACEAAVDWDKWRAAAVGAAGAVAVLACALLRST